MGEARNNLIPTLRQGPPAHEGHEPASTPGEPLVVVAQVAVPAPLEVIYLGDDFIESFPEAIGNFVSCTGIKRNSTNHRLSRTFPSYSKDYKRRCLRKHLRTGEACPFDLGTMFGTRWIISLPIRDHWREHLQPPLVKLALQSLVECCTGLGVTSLAVPLVEGPPNGWIEAKIREALAQQKHPSLTTLFLFKEE
jgi:hypothetical protein